VSESIVLSLIFAGIIALIGYIGATVGIARGFVLSAAIFAGSEAALWWGADIGRRLSDWFSVSGPTGQFLAAMFLLLIVSLLLGFSGSLVLAWGTPTRWGALLGALLGAANGALLIAMALRLYYLSYAGQLTSDPLDESVVTRILWRNFDWFILGFAFGAAILMLYTRFSRLQVTVPDPSSRISLSRPVPPPIPRTDQSVRRIEQSRLLDAQLANAASEANGAGANVASPGFDDTIYAPLRTSNPLPSERTTVVDVREPKVELPSARNTVRFCPNCGMTLDASDRFCPDCGYTL
jgi:zinc-ribbon domain